MSEQRFLLSAFVLFALALVADVGWFGFLRGSDYRASDVLVRAAAKSHPPDRDIVLLVADDRSVAILGEEVDRWPWPREVFGEVARYIAAQKPAAIVFDMVFADPDRARPGSDAALARMLAGLPNVYVAMLRSDPAGDEFGVSLKALASYAGLDPAKHADAKQDAKADILLPRALERGAWRLAAINFLGDEDGVGRRYPIAIDVFGWPLPSMGARVARDLGYRIPEREDITLAWPATVHRIVPFVDVWDEMRRAAQGEKPQRPADEFTGKIVMIGANATGVPDIHPTSMSRAHFGLDFIATAVDNLKHGDYLAAAPRWLAAAVGILLLAIVFAGYRAGKNSVKVGAMLLAASLALAGVAFAAIDRRVVMHIATPLWFAWSFYAVMALKTYLAERDLRRRATETFSRFVNPVVVGRLLSKGGFSREGEARDITVLFCDIRGFTTLSEGMEPKTLIELLNRHFERHVEIIFRHGGTLDKFIGDAMMALWGAPLDDPKHAEHAVACALDMRDALVDFRRGLPPEQAGFDIGIGIHSGSAVVGLIGPESRPEYTAVGDMVNVASRIEGLTAQLAHGAQAPGQAVAAESVNQPCRILVSEATRQRAGAAFDFLPAGHYKVKGRVTEVEVFQPRRRVS